MQAEIKIIDLDELIDSDAKPVKVAGYTIDLNKIPLKVLIEVNKMKKNIETCTEDMILKNIIHPLVKYQGNDVLYDEAFESRFTVKKIHKFWNMLLYAMYGIDVESNDTTGIQDTDKKKV